MSGASISCFADETLSIRVDLADLHGGMILPRAPDRLTFFRSAAACLHVPTAERRAGRRDEARGSETRTAAGVTPRELALKKAARPPSQRTARGRLLRRVSQLFI